MRDDDRQPGVDVGGVLVEGRRQRPPGRPRRAGRRGEPAGDAEEDADDDHRRRDARHQRGRDRPGLFGGGLDAFVDDQLVDDDPARDLAGDDHREAGGDQADAAEEHGHPAFVPGEVDRGPEGDEGEQREDQRQALQRDRDVLRGLQLVGAQDRHLGRVRRQLFGERGPDPDLVGEVRDQAAQLELDFAVFGRDRFLLVFEHRDQLFVGAAVGVLPEALGGRGFQHLFDAAGRGLCAPRPESGPANSFVSPGSLPSNSFSRSTFA